MKTTWLGIFIMLPFLYAHGQGKWEVLHNSEGEKFLCLDFISESKGWKADYSGVCTTDDGGESWTRIWEHEHVAELDFTSESTGHVIVREPGGLTTAYQTTDGGRSWDIIGKCDDFHHMLIVSESLQYSYSDHSIFRTHNGEDWELVLELGSGIQIDQLAFLNADTGVCVSRGQIHRTFDGGNTWSAIDIPDADGWRFTFMGDSISYLFSNLSDAPILFSRDFFDSSIDIPKPDTGKFEIHFFSEDTIMAYASDPSGIIRRNDRGFYQSRNRGRTWQKLSSEPIYYEGWLTIDSKMHFFGNLIYLICKWRNVDLLFRSEDRGAHWQQVNTVFPLVEVHFVSPEKGFLLGHESVFHGNASYLAVTENGGENWTCLTSPDPYVSDIHFLNDSLGFFGGHLRSRDGGQSWYYLDEEVAIIPSPNDPFEWMVSITGDEEESILRSEDGGLSWQTEYILKGAYLLNSDLMFILSENAGFAITNYDVHKFSREGIMNIDLGNQLPLEAIWFMDASRGVITGGFWQGVQFSSIIFRTFDGGKSWTRDTGFPFVIYDLHFTDSLHGFAVGQDKEGHGVLLETFDGGGSWSEVPVGVEPQAVLRDLHFCDGWGWAVGDKGLILRYNPGTTGVGDETAAYMDQDFSVYPNPFQSRTVISYRLPQACMVELSIYELSGRKVATLVSEWQPAARHEVEWNVQDVPPGIYLGELRTGPERMIGKLVVTAPR
jgi:photosystem II stability/assembly factor-like uncharacterized protein